MYLCEIMSIGDVEKIVNDLGREFGTVYPRADIIVGVKGSRHPYACQMIDYCDYKSTQLLLRLGLSQYRRIRWDKIESVRVLKEDFKHD